MSDSTRIPDFPICKAGPLCRIVLSRGYSRFWEVAESVKALPYGRPRNAEDAAGLFNERRGTCSTKHRFLAELARECGRLDVKLVLGLYAMCEANTPGVGAVLAEEGLCAIPEAHCYLMCGQQRFDFTGLPAGRVSPFASLSEEQIISPDDLPSAKSAYHRRALAAWSGKQGMAPGRAWAIRERCIAVLARSIA
jgi:hypothetical protein